MKKLLATLLLATTISSVSANSLVDKVKGWFGGINQTTSVITGNTTNSTVIGDTQTTVTQGSIKVDGTTNTFETKDIITIKNFQELIESNSKSTQAVLDQSNTNFTRSIELFTKYQQEQERRDKEWRETINKIIGSPPSIPIINGSSTLNILQTNSNTTPAYFKQEEGQNQLLISTLTGLNTTLSNLNLTSNNSMNASQVIPQTTSFTAEWGKTYKITAGANITVTLPTSVGQNGKDITLERVDSTAFVVTIDPNAAETINGQTTATLANGYSSNTIRADDTGNVLIVLGASNVAAEFGTTEITNGVTVTSVSFVDFSINQTFTVPTAGTWEISYIVNALNATGNQNANYQLLDVTGGNTVVTGSVGNTLQNANTLLSTISQPIIVTTTGANTYKLQGRTTSGTLTLLNNANGSSRFIYQKISGYLPVSGQSVDYAGVERRSADVNTNLFTIPSTNTTTFGTLLGTANRVNLSSATISGNLTVNGANGTIEIAKSGAYTITTNVSIQSAGTTGQWGQMVKNNATVLTASASYNQTGGAGLQVVLNYTGNFVAGDLIDVRLNSTAAGTIGVTGYSYSGNQLGSSAITTTTRAIVEANMTTQVATTGADVTISGLTEIIDTTGSFTPGTGIFIAPRAGYYRYSVASIYDGATTDTKYLKIKVNNVTVRTATNINATGAAMPTIVLSNIVLLAAGDSVIVTFGHSANGINTGIPVAGAVGNNGSYNIEEINLTF